MNNNLFRIEEKHRITVGKLIEMLRGYPDDTKITFGATAQGTPLMFFRVKSRGDDLVQIELNETLPEYQIDNCVLSVKGT